MVHPPRVSSASWSALARSRTWRPRRRSTARFRTAWSTRGARGVDEKVGACRPNQSGDREALRPRYRRAPATQRVRHLKASTLLNRGASVSEVQDVLGHADPSTSKAIVAHSTPQFLRERLSAAITRSLFPTFGRRRGQAHPIFWTTGNFPEQRRSGSGAARGKVVARVGTFTCSPRRTGRGGDL
jgi:hypothetical protein